MPTPDDDSAGCGTAVSLAVVLFLAAAFLAVAGCRKILGM